MFVERDYRNTSIKRRNTAAAYVEHLFCDGLLSGVCQNCREHAGRGHGFRPVFIGLMNMYGSLRFRSGDHALIMDGATPDISTAQLAQKPSMDGFFASVMCRKGAAEALVRQSSDARAKL
jgi:hypothetical protein